MAENSEEIKLNPKEILKQVERELRDKAQDALALLNATPKTSKQLLLFENLQEYNQIAKEAKQKTEKGLDLEQEAAAQLLALGFNKTETYLLTHPGCPTHNQKSLWVRASKFCNNAKIRLRVEDIKKAASQQALMPVTEAYQELSEIARNAAKDEVRRAAIVDILKIRGVFKEQPYVGVDIDLHYDKEDADA